MCQVGASRPCAAHLLERAGARLEQEAAGDGRDDLAPFDGPHTASPVAEDAGRGWRRMVPSPFPRKILEIETIRTLINAGVVTITAGGGGIPVIDEGEGEYTGITGAVDKDYAASLLAQELKADLLAVSTAVEKVAINFNQSNQVWFDRMTLSEAKQYLADGVHFAKGSMAPKIHAIIWFLENGGKEAFITNPENIGRTLKGETGTWFVHD